MSRRRGTKATRGSTRRERPDVTGAGESLGVAGTDDLNGGSGGLLPLRRRHFAGVLLDQPARHHIDADAPVGVDLADGPAAEPLELLAGVVVADGLAVVGGGTL